MKASSSGSTFWLALQVLTLSVALVAFALPATATPAWCHSSEQACTINEGPDGHCGDHDDECYCFHNTTEEEEYEAACYLWV